jgi:hypothetical protein
MSKRLQVLLRDSEMADIRRLARCEQMTVGEWVRRALRTQFKLRAIREAAEYSFPTADIDQMLREIKK